MSETKKIAIVILHYKGIKDTTECLRSVFKAEDKCLNIRVFLVNNNPVSVILNEASKKSKNPRCMSDPASGDDPIASLQGDRLTLIAPKQNLGFAGGNNLGIKKALSWQADYIVLLNNDTHVPKNLFINLIKEAEKDPKIGLISPKIYFEKGHEFHKEKYKKEDLGKVIWYAGGIIDWENVYSRHQGVDKVDKGQYDNTHETEFASGCCLLIKSFVFKRIGFLDEEYFLYWEDADFSIRARSAGIKVVYTGKTHLWHKNAGGSGVGSLLHDYYMTRNRLIFGFHYASNRTKTALMKESFKKLIFGRKWERIGARDFWLQKLGKGSYEI